MSKNVKTVSIQDYDAVLSSASKYAEGLRTGSIAVTRDAFHSDAIMYGFNDGALVGGPISNLYDFVENFGSAPEMSTRLDVIAITPTTAVVRVDMENDAIGRDYIDFLTLIKLEGAWKVIAKAFHQFDA
jgi:hypothetical protein